jgi:hypothetical protein
VTANETLNAIAVIEHDLKTGNLEHARKVMNQIFDGEWGAATPMEIATACVLVEEKMKEAGSQ